MIYEGRYIFFSNRVFAWLLLVHFFVVERVYMLTAFGKVGLFKNCRPQQASINLSGVASRSDTEVCIWLLSSVTKCRLIFELFQKSPAVHISGFCSLAFPLLCLFFRLPAVLEKEQKHLWWIKENNFPQHIAPQAFCGRHKSVWYRGTQQVISFIRTVIKYDI